ncbi:hypothetical protein CEXT_281411 [Caerostris extrusa]|uniref:Uncharacterized protein n=1 Tax=Caerostris extrusa TaxID=172846 RepID=A0AAV4XYD1_CAEEX|nr:hypothetical protein CEXT_281411 [Caerostris extrusa]
MRLRMSKPSSRFLGKVDKSVLLILKNHSVCLVRPTTSSTSLSCMEVTSVQTTSNPKGLSKQVQGLRCWGRGTVEVLAAGEAHGCCCRHEERCQMNAGWSSEHDPEASGMRPGDNIVISRPKQKR